MIYWQFQMTRDIKNRGQTIILPNAIPFQLISYIAPSAPATRRPATDSLPYLRPEVGFTPRWYHVALGIDFGERWHTDPVYRSDRLLAMRDELRRRFSGSRIGGIDRPNHPLDLLTGTFGACTFAGIYGLPIRYAADQWPIAEHAFFSKDEIGNLTPPSLDSNPFFLSLMEQLEWIAEREGRIEGFINWQGILNNAHRLRGEELFLDLYDDPQRCRHLFECICDTTIEACRRVHERQKASGVEVHFFTVSNCLVNMISPAQYRELLLPFDRKLAETFHTLGIHNCAWNADPYLADYATIPGVAYIDMGMQTNLIQARHLFPNARRAVMYSPVELAAKPLEQIRADFASIARQLGPCDIVLADIEDGTPDARIKEVLELCERISE